MTKTRFTAADVRAIVRDLRSSVLGLRVANVYDLDAKTFLFKLASPGQEKSMLLLESGVRFHTTKFTHEKSDMPSGFSMKLRKHIRTQRLEDVRQVGMDRVVDFKFGSGKASNHVILELYASGNIILTDSKYEILDLLRTHTYEGQGDGGSGGNNVRVAVRQIYPMELATTQEGTRTALPSLSDAAAGAEAPPAEAEREGAAEEEEEEAGAFVKGMPTEIAVQRMSEWLQRAAIAATTPPPSLLPPPPPPEAVAKNGTDYGIGNAAAADGGVPGKNGGGGGGGGKKKGGATKKPKKPTLKQALMQKGSGVSVYGPSVLEHCVLGAGLRPNAKLTVGGGDGEAGGTGGDHGAGARAGRGDAAAGGVLAEGGQRGGLSEDEVRKLVVALGEAEVIVQQLDRPGQQGYIQCRRLPAPAGGKGEGGASLVATGAATANGGTAGTGGEGGSGGGDVDVTAKGAGGQKAGKSEGGGDGDGEANAAAVDEHVVYEEFLPQLLAQHEGAVIHSFPSFDQAVDAFFGRIVEQKLKQTAIAAEAAVEKKVTWIRNDQERRVLALEERQDKMLRHAQLAEAWADEVEKALMVVRSALANGMDWQDLDELVKAETANGNPIASLIHELRLDRNQVVLALPTAEEGEDDQLVEVDIMLSAHANARAMYENKKLARVKELKTLKASEKVLRIAEQQAQKTLQRQTHKRNLQVARKVYWFEKFNWFITSENFLVLSGRNAQQNEVVVKKYLRPGDIYVHADLHGAASCVVRNKDPSGKRPVSPLALEEAGCMTVCRSGAWGAKMVTSAWWVYADQVSKTAPSGEYLVTGSFMVRGRKHFLPPRALEMGFALLFKLDHSCLAAHAGERREKLTNAEEEERDAAALAAGASRGEGCGGDGSREEGGGGGGGGGGGEAVENGDRRPVRFDAPVGLDDKRGDANAGDGGGGDGDAASRRAAALAALAGGGGGGGGGRGGGGLTWSATWEPGGRGRGAEMSGETSAPEAPKKRLSAKERKQAKKAAGKGSASLKDTVPADAAETRGNPPEGDQADDDDCGASPERSAGRDGGDGGSGGGGGGGRPKKGDTETMASSNANANASVPRGKRGKLKRMKKKYAEQDEEDRKLAMEALGKAPLPEDGGAASRVAGGRRRFLKESDRKEAAAAEAAAAAATSKNLRKTEAELTVALASLDPEVRGRLSELVKPDELDPFEVRALGKFDVANASDILDRFAEADLRKVRNRSGFLAGIMRKHGSAAATTTSTTTSGATPAATPAAAAEPSAGTAEATTPDVLAPAGAPPTAMESTPATNPENEEEEQEPERKAGTGAVAAGGDAETTGAQEEADGEAGEAEDATGDAGSGGGAGSDDDDGGGETGGDGDGEGSSQDGGGEEGGMTETTEPLSRRAQKKLEEEEIRKLLEEEGGAEDFEDGAGGVAGASELDRLTGKPRDEDVLLFAVPVCGPYMSLRDYKYKVKLTPGKQKRGKASKQAIEVFSRAKDTPASQKSLMKGVTDNECVAAMIGDVKVAVAGLSQATQARKKANKKTAQKDPNKSAKQAKAKGGKGGKGKK